jgi:protein TonB
MKKNNEIEPERVESFDEIVFENRNKKYGAYYLRKKNKLYVFFAFCIAILVVGFAVITPLIASYNNNEKFIKNNEVRTVTAEITNMNPDEPPPPPPPPPPSIKTIQMAKFTVPEVVDTVKEVNIKINDDPDPPIDAPPVFKPNPAPTAIEIDKDTDPLLIVAEPATFQGGDLNTFSNWVKQNLVYPSVALENNVSGKITLQFTVNTNGDVIDVKVLRGTDPAIDEEAVRVIQSSPKWTPARQNGVLVKQRFYIPINFQVQSN